MMNRIHLAYYSMQFSFERVYFAPELAHLSPPHVSFYTNIQLLEKKYKVNVMENGFWTEIRLCFLEQN